VLTRLTLLGLHGAELQLLAIEHNGPACITHLHAAGVVDHSHAAAVAGPCVCRLEVALAELASNWFAQGTSARADDLGVGELNGECAALDALSALGV